jgi:hypothetical protein
LEDFFVKENFFTDEEIDNAWAEVKPLPHKDKFMSENSNFYPGEKYSTVSKIESSNVVNLPHMTKILDKIRTVFEDEIVFEQMTYQQLHLPFSIHSDWDPIDIQKNIESYYNILVPFHDIDSRTVVFEEKSEKTNNFKYIRLKNKKVSNPVPIEVWQEHLSHCDINDREFLTLKAISPSWKKGQLIAIKRDIFHSSDAYHLKNVGTKHFLQIYSDKKLK